MCQFANSLAADNHWERVTILFSLLFDFLVISKIKMVTLLECTELGTRALSL
jgi:hypothetical protein